MNNNEELYSIKIAREQLEEMIKELTPRVNYLKTAMDSGQEHRGDYKEYSQKKALLEQLTNIRQGIIEKGERGESYLDKKSSNKRDEKIENVNSNIKYKQALLRELNQLPNNKKNIKEREKLIKEILSLQEKSGYLQDKQQKIVNKRINRRIKEATRESQIEANVERANKSMEYIENFNWSNKRGLFKVAENIGKVGKLTSEFTIGLISSFHEWRLNKYNKILEKKAGIVEGTRKLPSKLGNAIKNKIQQVYTNSISRGNTR